MPRPPSPDERRPQWPCRHGANPGTYDETARRASHEELGSARALASEGHHVSTVAESKRGRSPDLMACGVAVEVKSFRSLQEREGKPPSAHLVANKLTDASGQGAVAFIWGAGSGLREGTARRGYDLFCQAALQRGLGQAQSVRIRGDGFDLSFSPAVDLHRLRRAVGAQAPTARSQAELPTGLPRPLPPHIRR